MNERDVLIASVWELQQIVQVAHTIVTLFVPLSTLLKLILLWFLVMKMLFQSQVAFESKIVKLLTETLLSMTKHIIGACHQGETKFLHPKFS